LPAASTSVKQPHQRILLRAHQRPFDTYDPVQTLARNTIGDNVGNLLFSHSTYRLLSTNTAKITTNRFLTPDPGWLNENFDVVVLPLANAFRHSFVPTLEQITKIIERLRIPVVVLGVNAQLRSGADEPVGNIGSSVTAFVKAVLHNSPSIGVRGELTSTYLARLGFGGEEVTVIGCPAMFTYGPSLPKLREVDHLDRESPISMNVSPYVRGIGKLVETQSEKYPNLVYTAQDIATLGMLLTGRYRSSLPVRNGVPHSITHPLVSSGRTVMPVSVPAWLDYLEGFQFSFGTRIHGNIAALLAGTPAFVLSHDSRTAELAEYHRIPQQRFKQLADDFDAAELYQRADFAAIGQAHPERWQRFSQFLGQHNLQHIYEDGARPSDFDQRIAATAYPPIADLSPRQLPQVLIAKATHLVRRRYWALCSQTEKLRRNFDSGSKA